MLWSKVLLFSQHLKKLLGDHRQGKLCIQSWNQLLNFFPIVGRQPAIMVKTIEYKPACVRQSKMADLPSGYAAWRARPHWWLRLGDTQMIMRQPSGPVAPPGLFLAWRTDAINRQRVRIVTSFESGRSNRTLPEHAECGEEWFQVEWHSEDDSVWYDIPVFISCLHGWANHQHVGSLPIHFCFERQPTESM